MFLIEVKKVLMCEFQEFFYFFVLDLFSLFLSFEVPQGCREKDVPPIDSNACEISVSIRVPSQRADNHIPISVRFEFLDAFLKRLFLQLKGFFIIQEIIADILCNATLD